MSILAWKIKSHGRWIKNILLTSSGLTTTRANRGNMDDFRDNSKEYVKELEDDDNEKENTERFSSVYGNTSSYFISIDILY